MTNSTPSPTGAWLESSTGETTPLAGNCLFGRSRSCTVVVFAESASRQHATIHAQNGGEFWLIDLGSRNGTLLNGVRVSQPTRLNPGDQIGIADFYWTFRQDVTLNNDPESTGDETLVTVAQIRRQPSWLLLADIENFTPLSQKLEPQALAGLVGGWMRSGREVLATHSGTLNKYLGDGFLAFWLDGPGVPEKVLGAMKDFSALQTKREPPFRIVIHKGDVSMGGASLGEESLMGAEVNYIFRLEKLASGLKIPCGVSAGAAEAFGPLLPTKLVEGEHALKGFEGKHQLFVPVEA